MRAKCPDWTYIDIRAMFHEEEGFAKDAQTAIQFYEAIEAIQPTATELVVESEASTLMIGGCEQLTQMRKLIWKQ